MTIRYATDDVGCANYSVAVDGRDSDSANSTRVERTIPKASDTSDNHLTRSNKFNTIPNWFS